MTIIASHQIALVIIDCLIFNPEAAGCGHFRQRGSGQIGAVAGLAAGLVVLIKVFVTIIIPAGVGDVVQAVGAAGRPGQTAGRMAGFTCDDGSGESLELYGGQVVVGGRIGVGPDGVGAAMAAFTGDAAVAFAEAEKGVRVFGKALVGCQERRSGIVTGSVRLAQAERPVGVSHQISTLKIRDGITGVAGLAAGQVLPGAPRAAVVGAVDAAAGQQRGCAAHRQHVAVAVETVHVAGGHGPALALGDVAWVALVAVVATVQRWKYWRSETSKGSRDTRA